MDGAFFTEDQGLYRPSELTRGPWDPGAQHGGPPAALLAGALERAGEDAGQFFVARVTLELYRPVPLAPLRIETRLLRGGKRVQRWSAQLYAGEALLVEAQALRIVQTPLRLPPPAARATPPVPTPEVCPLFELNFFTEPVAYHRAIEIRWIDGVWANGPVAAWVRPTVPLVAGRDWSPLERVMVVADAESGLGPPLPPSTHTFVNPDLNVYRYRPLIGEWVGMRVESHAGTNGVGLAQSAVFDAHGDCGRSLQSLVLQERQTATLP